MTTMTLHAVEDFAQAVRSALADLPPDEVDDLTDGLEADLAERASDQQSPDFGDPLTYAQELRAAAGLPPRVAQRSATIRNVGAATWNEFVGGLRELPTHPLTARLVSFLVALRPLWWVFRAWMFYGVLTRVLGVGLLAFNLGAIGLGLACLILSVQLGRGRWQPRAWMRTALRGVNVLLVLAVPLALSATSAAFTSEVQNAFDDGQSQSTQSYSGLSSNGHQITNIFAYDASGKPLTDVQLFDQDGKPLDTVPDAAAKVTVAPYLVPNSNVVGRQGWNVYPLRTVAPDQLDPEGDPKANAKSAPATPTFLIVAPLSNAGITTPTPTSTPTPVPTH